MAFDRWDGSAFVPLTTARRWDGSSWVDGTFIRRWDGSTWVDVLTAPTGLTATAIPMGASAYFYTPNEQAPPTRSMTTNVVTIETAGGTGPGPTYQWTRIAGSAAISANSPTAAATSFSAIVAVGTPVSATFRCRVTQGAEVVDVVVPVDLAYDRGIIN